MYIGLNTAIVGQNTPSLTQAVSSLFSNNEQGVWFDPSDLSTLFQDSAGTTPVTAVEQPVGRILDKSGRGKHATQSTTPARPVLSRRVNLFTESEFRNGVTDATTRGGLISASTISGYIGAVAVGADGITSSFLYKSQTVSANTPYLLSVVVEMQDGLAPNFLSAEYATASNDFRLLIAGDSPDPRTYVVTNIGASLYKVSVTHSLANPSSANNGLVKYANNSARTFKITAYDLRLATDAHLPYQRVNTATDYDADPAKFPAYLRFDGVDDALQTGNIDFTGTDKMTVWAGYWNISGATASELVGLSAAPYNNTGTFLLTANYAGNDQGVVWCAKGLTAGPITSAGRPSPYGGVFTGLSDLGGGTISLRENGAVISQNLGSFGGGSFGNYPLYIGARNQSILYFNGRLYGLIVRGAQSTDSQIGNAEAYMNNKIRAY